jgi:hypothetical protein
MLNPNTPLSPSQALRMAQIEMWEQQQWKSPYFWAAFTLQGEWRSWNVGLPVSPNPLLTKTP